MTLIVNTINLFFSNTAVGDKSNEVHLQDSDLDDEVLLDLSPAPPINLQCPIDQSTTNVIQSFSNGSSVVTPSVNILVQAPSCKCHINKCFVLNIGCCVLKASVSRVWTNNIGGHIGPYSTNMWTDTLSICYPILSQMSVNMFFNLIDPWLPLSVDTWLVCWLKLGQCLNRYVTLTVGGISANFRWYVSLLSVVYCVLLTLVFAEIVGNVSWGTREESLYCAHMGIE